MTRRFFAWLAALVGICVLAGGFALYSSPAGTAAPMAGSVVKLSQPRGHGSAVHIGDGYFLTAGHVISEDAKTQYTVKFDSGATQPAEVLWTNRKYDIALVRVADYSGIAASSLSCRVPALNEDVTASGNPLSMEWITTRGWVAGSTMKTPAWDSVFPMSMPAGPGMSGGAIFDSHGRVVGILVGAPLVPIGMGATTIGITYAVDGLTICGLLARV